MDFHVEFQRCEKNFELPESPDHMSQKPKDANLRQQIDENLRRVYQEKVEEAIPDRFAELLRQLRNQDDANGLSIGHDK